MVTVHGVGDDVRVRNGGIPSDEDVIGAPRADTRRQHPVVVVYECVTLLLDPFDLNVNMVRWLSCR